MWRTLASEKRSTQPAPAGKRGKCTQPGHKKRGSPLPIRNPPEPKPPSTDSKHRPAHGRARPPPWPSPRSQSPYSPGRSPRARDRRCPPGRLPRALTPPALQSARARAWRTVPGRSAARSPPRAPTAAAHSSPRAPSLPGARTAAARSPPRARNRAGVRTSSPRPHPSPTRSASASARCTARPRATRQGSAPQNAQRAPWAFKGTAPHPRRCCREAASGGGCPRSPREVWVGDSVAPSPSYSRRKEQQGFASGTLRETGLVPSHRRIVSFERLCYF